MKTKFIAMIAIALGASSAFAQESGESQFFNQADAGESQLTVGLGYASDTFKSKAPGAVDVKRTGLDSIYAQYEYGFNEMLSAGARLSYQSTEIDPGGGGAKPKVSGLEDPTVYLRGRNQMGGWDLHYGADLGLGFSKKKVETNGDQDAMSGGLSLAPYVGADAMVGPGLLGARLRYTWLGERTFDAGGTDAKFKGADLLDITAFYEYMLSDMKLAAALTFSSVSEEKQTAPGAEVKSAESYSPVVLDLYAVIPAGTTVEIIPSLTWGLSAGGDQFDKYNPMTLAVAGRFSF